MRLHVLIVEDSDSDAALIVRTLERFGYAVSSVIVEKAEAMQAALESQNWDLIIADYRLPQFNAPAALILLQKTGHDIPFIVVSGAIGEETAVNLMKAGACDYLLKGNLARLGPVVEREIMEAQIRKQEKAANEALIESQRNLQQSQIVAHIGHWLQKFPSGKFIWSDEIYRIFDLKVGSDVEDPELFLRNHLEPLHKGTPGIFELKPGEQAEYFFRRPDGKNRFIFATACDPVKDKDGRVVQYSGVLQDITHRKNTELELREKIEESQLRARELEIIGSLSSKLRHANSLGEMVEITLKELTGLMEAKFATLGLVDGENLKFDLAFGGAKVWKPREISQSTITFGNQSSTPNRAKQVRILDCDMQGLLPEWIKENIDTNGKTVICLLASGENVVGVVILCLDSQNTLPNERIDLILSISDIIGNAINRKQASNKLETMVERREKELDYIYKITSVSSSHQEIRLALKEALKLTLAAVQAENGGIYLLDESGLQPKDVIFLQDDPKNLEVFEQIFNLDVIQSIIENRRTLLFPERENQPVNPRQNESAVGLPMQIQGRIVGVLAVRKTRGKQVNVEELTLLSFIADHLALIVENARLIQKAEKSAITEERARLARALHDSVTQQLYSTKLYSVGARRFLQQQNLDSVDEYLAQINDLTQQALKDLRMMLFELRSLELEESGLVGALKHRIDAVEKRLGIHVSLNIDDIPALAEALEENLYRIAIEALNNSLKHAQAESLIVEVKREKNRIKMVVQDDGNGFDMRSIVGQGGMGLATMRERAKKISARFLVESSPGTGARIEIDAPISIKSEI